LNLRKVSGARIKVSDAVGRARAVKTSYEISHIRAAAKIASAGMRKAESILRAGRTELSLAAEVEHFIRARGSESPPFYDGLLLASGPESADIHAHPSRRVVGRGIVLVDLGAKCSGYYSDMTRTFCVGRPTRQERGLMEFVENLRDECVDMLSPGVRASEVYDYVSAEIRKKRLVFYHSLGHGIGLEVHESPNLGAKSSDILTENMVFTVEPGVYLPGKFGVRFEDTVVLTKNGAKKLT
jgi:Xaa-Pro aminopeptidase